MLSMRDLQKCLAVNIKADIPTMIWGAPGVGKSDVVKATAKELGMSLIDFRATLRDPVDMRGLPLVDAKTGTTRWLAPAELPQVKRDGEKGIFFLDELPQANQAMQSACFGLVLDRYLGEYKLPPGWIPVAAGNRFMDRAGAQRMPTPLRNRFAHFEVVADIESWRAWAAKVNLNPLVSAFIAFRPNLLFNMPEGEENSFPTPRAWERVAKIADCPDEELRRNLVTALVGAAAAIEFEGFVRVWTRLPSIDRIFRDPKAVAVPDLSEPAVLYAIATAISRRVTSRTMTNAMSYAGRLPKEFQVMLAVDAVRRDPTLKETKAFGTWYADNAEVLI